MLQLIFYNIHIKETADRCSITIKKGFLCKIKPSLFKLLNTHINCINRDVFLNTKSLKHIHDRHIYDKKTPKDFFTILFNLTKIIKYPDEVRRNLESKRGDFLFIKRIEEQLFYVSIEVVEGGLIEIVSSSITTENYLKKFTLLWSWETANLPS